MSGAKVDVFHQARGDEPPGGRVIGERGDEAHLVTGADGARGDLGHEVGVSVDREPQGVTVVVGVEREADTCLGVLTGWDGGRDDGVGKQHGASFRKMTQTDLAKQVGRVGLPVGVCGAER